MGLSLETPYTEGLFTIEQFVDDLDSVRQQLGYEKITVMGHSWGTRIALEYALSYPDRVSALILIAPAPITYQGQMSFYNEFIQPRLQLFQDMMDAAIVAQSNALTSFFFIEKSSFSLQV